MRKPVLDTCLITEMMRLDRDAGVVAWLSSRSIQDLSTTAITVTETTAGFARHPDGRRRAALERAAEGVFGALEVLPHTEETARIAGRMIAAQGRSGRVLKFADACIAAIAFRAGCPLVTRDGDFDGIADHEAFKGFEIINPWLGDV